MKTILAFIVTALLASGCVVHTHGHARRGCGPAHHWENGRCVHNGHGKHKHKHKHKDKDVIVIRDNRR